MNIPHSMLVSLLWLSLGLVMYEYVGHPALLFLLARVRPQKWREGDVQLSVAVFISAFNEEKGIEKDPKLTGTGLSGKLRDRCSKRWFHGSNGGYRPVV